MIRGWSGQTRIATARMPGRLRAYDLEGGRAVAAAVAAVKAVVLGGGVNGVNAWRRVYLGHRIALPQTASRSAPLWHDQSDRDDFRAAALGLLRHLTASDVEPAALYEAVALGHAGRRLTVVQESAQSCAQAVAYALVHVVGVKVRLSLLFEALDLGYSSKPAPTICGVCQSAGAEHKAKCARAALFSRYVESVFASH